MYTYVYIHLYPPTWVEDEGVHTYVYAYHMYIYNTERWGAGVETQKNVREEIGGWGRVPFNEAYAPLLSTIYDGA